MATVPHVASVLRAVLCHAPNLCPPERVFSILNNSWGANQSNAHADYIELSCRLQYNARTRKP